jgi:nitrogen fixation protein NifU and related proteins
MNLAFSVRSTLGSPASTIPGLPTMDSSEAVVREKLRQFYSDITIDHMLHPRNTERIRNPDGIAECRTADGESLKMWLTVRNKVVDEIGFSTNGCAATVASGSMATELAKGKTVPQALALTAQDVADALTDLPGGNLHCAALAARALGEALRDCLAIQQTPWKKAYRR